MRPAWLGARRRLPEELPPNVSYRQITGGPGTGMVVRTAVDAASITPAVRQAIWSADPNQPVARIETFEDIIGRPLSAPSQSTALPAAFALHALRKE